MFQLTPSLKYLYPPPQKKTKNKAINYIIRVCHELSAVLQLMQTTKISYKCFHTSFYWTHLCNTFACLVKLHINTVQNLETSKSHSFGIMLD